MGIELEQTKRNSDRADKVNALLSQAEGLNVQTTRRQGRKALSGRGHLMQDLKEAEAKKSKS